MPAEDALRSAWVAGDAGDGQAREGPVEEARVEARGHREGELKVRLAAPAGGRSAPAIGGRLWATSCRRLPGQHGQHRSRGVEPLRGEERGAVCGRTRELDERVAHEGHGHAGLAVERLLEGEDHDHVRDALADRAHPPAAPRPHLRRDVVDDGDAAPLQLAGEAQVELGVVDEHRHGRALPLHLLEDGAEHARAGGERGGAPRGGPPRRGRGRGRGAGHPRPRAGRRRGRTPRGGPRCSRRWWTRSPA